MDKVKKEFVVKKCIMYFIELELMMIWINIYNFFEIVVCLWYS